MKDHVLRTANMQSASATVEPPTGAPLPAGGYVSGTSSRPLADWLPVALLAAILLLVYHRIFAKLAFDWYDIPDYSHGFLVPIFSLFLLWDRRVEIRRAAATSRASWSGIPVVILGLAVLILGVYGADLFLSRISFIILLTGIIWTLCGSNLLRVVRFPLLVLLLAIPFPAIVFNQITFPLQLLASRMASQVLPLLGVPTLQEGNIIELPVMRLEVAQACSGIRSLMSLFTLAVFYGYFIERTTARRVALAIASVPIAVLANTARIVGTGLCVQYWDPDKAQGFFHEFSGWVMFLISLSCLYIVHKVMNMIPPRRRKTA